MNPGLILLAAVFTGLTSWAIGLLALQALRIRLHRQEAWLTAYVLGSAGLSLAVFGMLTISIARPVCFAVLGITAIALCVWRKAWRIGDEQPLARVPAVWKWIFAALIAAYGTYTFVNALAPDISPDGIAYHLGVVGRWFRAGGFEVYTTNMYANMPMGIEMLFLFAYSFGRHSSAALVHWQFYVVLALLLLNVGRRFNQPVAGAVAGLLVFLSPIVAVDAASSYVDIATSAVVVTMFSLLLLFEAQGDRRLLLPVGVLAGFAYACKMTAFPALPFALGYVAFVLWRARSSWKAAIRPLLTVSCAAMIFIAPWLIKNAVMTGNPFSPFLNRWFPNPHIHVSFEQEYRAQHRTYYGRIHSFTEIPKEVTVKGGSLQGLLGPVFLLAPIGLVALRWPLGRRSLAAVLVFAAAYPSNIGTRFLLLALPFASLAMSLVFARWRGTAAMVVLTHAFLSWPDVIPAYSDPYAWRLQEFRWREALRVESEDAFFASVAPTVSMAKLIEKHVPPTGRVLTYGGVAEAYTSRDILVVYQAGLNNLLGDILVAGFSPAIQGTHRWGFRFPPVPLQRLRIVQSKTIAEQWGVSEIRLYSKDDRELPRLPSWRVRAHPNPWEVQLAFDDCPITRWKTWQSSQDGDFIEIDLAKASEVSMVVVDLAPDQVNAVVRVEGETGPGVWKSLSVTPDLISAGPVKDSRIAAIGDLQGYGVTHLAISNEDFIAEELYRNQSAWGISLVGKTDGARLYKLNENKKPAGRSEE